MWFYVALAAAVVAFAAPHGPQKTPPAHILDKNAFIENCMLAGEHVGECMDYISWEA